MKKVSKCALYLDDTNITLYDCYDSIVYTWIIFKKYKVQCIKECYTLYRVKRTLFPILHIERTPFSHSADISHSVIRDTISWTISWTNKFPNFLAYITKEVDIHVWYLLTCTLCVRKLQTESKCLGYYSLWLEKKW